MVMDARAGTATTIFYEAFSSYSLDPDTNTIVLQSFPFFDRDEEKGLYLIEASEPYDVTLISAPGMYSVSYIGLDGYPYFGFTDERGTALVRSDGSQKPLSDVYLLAVPAPTANLLALTYSPTSQGDRALWIYDTDLDERTDVYAGYAGRLEWRPDSGAIFYISGHELRTYTLDTGEHMLIYAWPGSPVSRSVFTWVNLP
jgi:hypothetical protein